MKRLFFILLIIIPSASIIAEGKEGYYRYPAIHGNTVVFTAEGDLWKVDINGGVARRLTTHQGMEVHPEISPDGKEIAFSAQYEGPTEIYTMPIEGGLPTRRTYEGGNATVIGWTSQHQILYRTTKYSTLPNAQLVVLDSKNNKKTLIPLAQASDGMYDPTGKTLFFTRLPFQGSQTKRYMGGTVQNLWKFTTGETEAKCLTPDYSGTSKQPLIWLNRIYFISDRDGTMNIWSMKEDGSDLKQHTFHKGWDASNPSLYKGKIVYQCVCDLFLYDIDRDIDKKLEITLSSDFDQTRERWVKEPMDYLTTLHLSPVGDRIVLTARGQIFVAPVKQGRLVQVTRKNGVRYRNGRFLPSGKNLIALSDETGELEYWSFPADGVGEGNSLTSDGKVFRYEGVPSPDGKWMAYRDKDYQLWIYDMTTKNSRRIAVSKTYNFSDLAWSPDSRWLAYVIPADNRFARIMLYDNSTGETTPLTSDRADSYNPAWSPDGKWLYFLSDRFFQSVVESPWGPNQPEPYFDRTTKIYMMALTSESRSPFLPDDELIEKKRNDQEEKGENEKKNLKKEKGIKIKIELNGIQNRVSEVPVQPGSYSDLTINDKILFWVENIRSPKKKQNLMALEIKNTDIKPEEVTDEIKGYELSIDGRKILIRKGDAIYVIDASAKPVSKLNDNKVDLSRWTFSILPRDEWRQMFIEAWRLERDYFYDPNMHGVDYVGLLKNYLPLVERVTDRDELSDLIAHLVGELSALHIFVRNGDTRRGNDAIELASLGAQMVPDRENGGYRIDHIYQTEPDYVDQLSPLAKPELSIIEGDIITAINGVDVLSVPDPGVLLKNQAGQQVLLSLKSEKTKKSYKAIVKPISQREESNLRYNEWEYTRRQRVEEMGKGEIGYVHLRAMGGSNYSEWVRNFYPVHNRKGLILDVRHNRGGNIDSWILEKLMRKAWFYWQSRVGEPTWNMQYAFLGHMVILCNEKTASDGEALTEGFRRLGLGDIIGTRTWGGEIWLSFSNYLVDRGIASAAETGVYGPEGQWLIEGRGAEPDIVVDNLPHATFNGKDAQLDTAVKYLQEKIKKEPVVVPKHPSYPDKSFNYE